MAFDSRLVRKGADEPFQALVDQARYHVKLAEQHAPALADANWTPPMTAALAAEVAAVDTDKNRQIDERAGARGSTRDEASAITAAKELINSVRNVARQVVRKNPDAGVALDDFHAGGPLGRVASKISSYLTKLRVPAAKLETAFAPFLKQQLVTKLIDEAKAKLDQASATQEVDIAGLPADTAAVYERKGRILEHIEDLNAIARNAFAKDAVVRAAFNKDILNRGRKGPKPAEPPAPPSPPTPPR